MFYSAGPFYDDDSVLLEELGETDGGEIVCAADAVGVEVIDGHIVGPVEGEAEGGLDLAIDPASFSRTRLLEHSRRRSRRRHSWRVTSVRRPWVDGWERSALGLWCIVLDYRINPEREWPQLVRMTYSR